LTSSTGGNRERKIFRASARLLPEIKDNRCQVLLMMEDITREKEMEAQLVHSGRMSALGEMASGVAHELNQPLNGIAAFIQLLQSRLDAGKKTPEDELQTIYQDLLHEVNRMSDIIGQLRVFHRSGKFTSESSPVDIHGIYQNSIKLIRTQLGKQGIELRDRFDGQPPVIYTDESRLEQLFINLVLNARDALAGNDSAEKIIEVGCNAAEREGRQGFRIYVKDNGPGIPDNIREKIFDPFFTTKDPDKGTGLGLAICYQYVADMTGVIEALKDPDGGAVFQVWLPADRRS
jgi:C4-dicarboxylate-specific signal transduction histidine kinase